MSGLRSWTKPVMEIRRYTWKSKSLHPDGQSFATSVGVPRFDIWLVDNLSLPGADPSRE